MSKTDGKSFEDSEEIKKKYERLIKNSNKNRKAAFRDINWLGMGSVQGAISARLMVRKSRRSSRDTYDRVDGRNI